MEKASPTITATHSFISELVVSHSTGRLVVHVARARHGPDGLADGGVLTTAFAPGYFERLFAAVAATPATGLILAREDGAVLARAPVGVATAGQRLAADDPVMRTARAARPGEPAVVVESGSLVGGFHLLAVRRIADHPLIVAFGVDPAAVRAAWLHQTAPFALSALIAMLLLLLLTGRVQRRLDVERAALAQRTASAEQGATTARTRAELEARLRQTEKIAALGQLSAGVAHDINNMLQSIVLSAESIDRGDVSPAEAREASSLILSVCERGAALTRRMLDYARRDDHPEGDTDVARSLGNLAGLLEGSLGPRYRLRLDPGAADGLWAKGHPAEFETVVINLVANARDAMPGGGTIAIAVHGVEQFEAPPGNGLPAGRYLRVCVSDAGEGMDPATLAEAGEAFFTTKPRGRGTGLGLSMARGFARRCGGRLELRQRPRPGRHRHALAARGIGRPGAPPLDFAKPIASLRAMWPRGPWIPLLLLGWRGRGARGCRNITSPPSLANPISRAIMHLTDPTTKIGAPSYQSSVRCAKRPVRKPCWITWLGSLGMPSLSISSIVRT